MVPTSARRRIEKKTTSQSSAEAPSYTMGAVRLSTSPLPIKLMETIQKGKQTNKQTSRGSTCGGADAGGGAELHSMQSLIHNASEYMEELWRCIGKAQGPMCRVVL